MKMVNKYWQVLFLIIGVGSIQMSISFFPVLKTWTVENFIGEIIFSPYKIFLGSFMFIFGFLSLSFVISILLRIGQVALFNRRMVYWQTFMIGCLLAVFMYLILSDGLIGGVAVLLSIIYGIMDGGLLSSQKKKRQERRES